VAAHLESREFLLERFSVADGYLFYALRSFRRVTQKPLPTVLEAYAARMAQRPAVREALTAEGVTY
jgi:glutathione S-transferase